MAAVAGISIIDRDRLWWPSISTNSPLPANGWTHPRQIGFCSYTLLAEAAEVLVVEDASKDRRYDSSFSKSATRRDWTILKGGTDSFA